MKLLKVVFFTETGKALADRIFCDWDQAIAEIKSKDDNLDIWVKKAFEEHQPIVFIGAMGIAVRKIAPHIQNKLYDSPVIVIDELGQFVIPVLSGHYGGANELAALLSERIGATAVITTATDINKAFAIDVFAKENGLLISDKDKIKKVSSKILKGQKVLYKCLAGNVVFTGDRPSLLQDTDSDKADFCIDDTDLSVQDASKPLTLVPKRMVIGIGCKKGKSFEELKDFVLNRYDEEKLRRELYAICSIDVKSREPGLIKLSQYLGVHFFTYSADVLNAAPGIYEESDFVRETVGVGNVCERAAILGAGSDAEIIVKKTAGDGMTFAESKRKKIEIIW